MLHEVKPGPGEATEVSFVTDHCQLLPLPSLSILGGTRSWEESGVIACH